MKLHEIFDRDPRSTQLANNGQARITNERDEKAIRELRAELETFVCDGQFGDGLQRILDRYLGNLGHTRQDGVWVSGFFGSGKSHLLKALHHFWLNTAFGDGATARNLVRGGLPPDVQANLRELDIQAQRTGLPLVAAADTLLGGNDRVRETVLAILLRARGWPSQYAQADFCFWLRERGWLDQVRAAVEGAGRNWLKELNDLYVSPLLRRALLEADPKLASSEDGVGEVLASRFPQRTSDITTLEFVRAAKLALEEDGQLPLTLLVLDEVQQYVHDSGERAGIIVEVAEALQTQFDSRVLVVGAGQSSLSAGTHALQWLRDRFKVSIQLNDADVEAVTRKVVLHKKPTAEPDIDSLLEAHAGEVARHLRGTQLGEKSEDRRDRVADYPLLPTRRRFWEECFRAVDAAGTHSQLRSQLRILHDAITRIAGHELGAVLPASELFNALAPDLVNTGVLLNELHTRIQRLDDGTPQGHLRRDLCGLAFLVGKLPREQGVDLGVRANAGTLADLLVRDIAKDSGAFRKEVADALGALVEDGTLMKVGEEYRLQTTQGAEWDRAYREKQASLRQNEADIANRRDHLFTRHVQDAIAGVKLLHGESKLPRSLALHVGQDPPPASTDRIAVWVRDGWTTPDKDVLAEARNLGQDDPTLHLHLPKKSADLLATHLIEVEAANQVLDHFGEPSTPEGKEAREGMESRRRNAEGNRDGIVRDILRSARLIQGGGTEVYGESLQQKLQEGAQASLARLFPFFDEGDHRAWKSVLKRARDGSDEPLKVVGWDQATEAHPVAKAVLDKIGVGARGSELHKQLKAAPYGWPQDAIDAMLVALHRAGHVRAARGGLALSVNELDQAVIKSAEFRPETVRLGARDRITLRGMFECLGLNTGSGQEERDAPDYLKALRRLADNAGGEAPLPPRPDTGWLRELEQLSGTEQLAAILERKDRIEECRGEWQALARRVGQRAAAWVTATELRRHARGLAVAEEVGPQLDAMIQRRSLLDDADHATPLASRLASGLRTELTSLHKSLEEAVAQAGKQLADDATWARLDEADRAGILRRLGLDAPDAPAMGGDAELLASLGRRNLAAWQAEIDAVPARQAKALDLAAEQTREHDPEQGTTTVSLRRGTLGSEAEVQAWLDEHGKKLMEAVARGPVIVK